MCTQTVNLLVTLDRNYLAPLTAMLKSYAEHHAEVPTDVYVLHSALSEEDFRALNQALSGRPVTFHDIRIAEQVFRNTPVLERLPEESFYRLLAFCCLPAHVGRCLYLDPDILVMRTLLPLYQTEMGDAYLAAAGHLHSLGDTVNKARLGLADRERYFNSGVMLMNLDAIRKDFTRETVLECLEENIQRLLLGDQDLANLLFGDKILLLDERIYNLDERSFARCKRREGMTLDAVRNRTAIIHYNGKYKPWLEGYRGELDCFYPAVPEKGPAPSGLLKKHLRSVYRITRPTGLQRIAVFGMLSLLLVCLFSYFFFGKELTRLLADPTLFRAWLDSFGPFDEVIFILVRAAQTVVKFIPAEPLEIGSGYAWGAIPGMLYCVIGNLLGTLVILALTRRFGQKIVGFFLPTKNTGTLSFFKSSKHIYTLLFFLYLIPGSPKDGFTYLAGLLPVKTLPFMLITGIARIPSVLSSTICGETLAQQNYLLSALIFALTVLLAVSGGILYRAYTKCLTELKQLR